MRAMPWFGLFFCLLAILLNAGCVDGDNPVAVKGPPGLPPIFDLKISINEEAVSNKSFVRLAKETEGVIRISMNYPSVPVRVIECDGRDSTKLVDTVMSENSRVYFPIKPWREYLVYVWEYWDYRIENFGFRTYAGPEFKAKIDSAYVRVKKEYYGWSYYKYESIFDDSSIQIQELNRWHSRLWLRIDPKYGLIISPNRFFSWHYLEDVMQVMIFLNFSEELVFKTEADQIGAAEEVAKELFVKNESRLVIPGFFNAKNYAGVSSVKVELGNRAHDGWAIKRLVVISSEIDNFQIMKNVFKLLSLEDADCFFASKKFYIEY